MDRPRKHEPGVSPPGLGELLALGLKGEEAWTPEELEAALTEQISVPVEFELGALKPGEAKSLRARTESHGLLLKNLRELFLHSTPPLELLILAKDFFKANSSRPHPGLPADVARVLYYLTLAVAWLRHHSRISTLSDAQVQAALNWVMQQGWVTDDLRKLAAEAAKQMDTKASAGDPST